jgi:hypothetical protein
MILSGLNCLKECCLGQFLVQLVATVIWVTLITKSTKHKNQVASLKSYRKACLNMYLDSILLKIPENDRYYFLKTPFKYIAELARQANCWSQKWRCEEGGARRQLWAVVLLTVRPGPAGALHTLSSGFTGRSFSCVHDAYQKTSKPCWVTRFWPMTWAQKWGMWLQDHSLRCKMLPPSFPSSHELEGKYAPSSEHITLKLGEPHKESGPVLHGASSTQNCSSDHCVKQMIFSHCIWNS